jgi:Ser/Thr protein kinase RdoA (MazF antagonist)
VRAALPIGRLRQGLAAWGLGDADVVGITPGATSDVFLVMAGPSRWVAKFNYDYRSYFETGLRVSQLVDARVGSDAFEVAVPVPTRAGELTALLEWPPETFHPLALLTFVHGDPLEGPKDEAARVLGEVCGRVHAALIDLTPGDVGLTSVPDQPDGNYPDRSAGPYEWLHALWRRLEQDAWSFRHELRHAPAVWDGPDIRQRPSGLGVLDFGHCGWHSIAHVVSNRSLNAALVDRSLLVTFLEAVERHLPLTRAEHDHLALHRARNIAIYARWVAMEKVARNDPGFNDRWFRELLQALPVELEAAGVPVPSEL